MNEQERALRELIAEQRNKIRAAISIDDLDAGETHEKEMRKLERKLNLVASTKEEIGEVKKEDHMDKKEKRSVSEFNKKELNEAYTGVFLKAFRGRKLNNEDQDIYKRVVREQMLPKDVDGATVEPYFTSDGEGTGAILVPTDISAKIQTYKREMEYDLTTLVSMERVGTLSGSRPFEKLADAKPWTPIEEWDKIPEHEVPEFEQKAFKIASYAGIIPIPRTMLQDSDANLIEFIARYIARKTLITRNMKILEVIEATFAEKTLIEDVAGLKTMLNVTLDAAFAFNAKIITNQDGYNVMDLWVGEDGKPVLEEDETVRSGKVLKGREIVVLPNRTLKSYDADGATNAPILIGDMKEAVAFFDRGVYEIESTTIGGQAFQRNTLDTRVIDRFDVQAWDAAAVLAGEVEVSPAP